MTLGTRLVLGLGLVVVLVMGIYGATSLRQREQLLAASIARETGAMVRALRAVPLPEPDSAGRVLDPLLRSVRANADYSIAAVVTASGDVTGGGPSPLPLCVDTLLPSADTAELRAAWIPCGSRSLLLEVAALPDGAKLVVARGTELLDRDLATSRRRILLTAVALTVLASFAILLLLRAALTQPLARIMQGVRATGGPLPPAPLPVLPRHQASELRELALAFNEMVERLEGKRRSLAREIEERIELDRRLRRAESFAALGRLTGGVAHELGSPLGVIGVRAEAIQTDAAATDAVRRHAAEISSEVARIARLVRDLIHVARRHGPGADRVDVAALLDELVAETRAQAAAAGVELTLDPPRGGAVAVEGDATLLRHAVFNVLLNSLQALRGHGGEKRITLQAQRAGEVARIAIHDTGPGIAAEHYPHLFEPFFTTRDVGEGSGLGLSISAGIAEEHGGTLTIVPGRDGGVSAYFDLPALVREEATRT